jgi:hypothetical protein
MNIVDRPLLETIKILETRDVRHELYEICATAQAVLDESSHQLTVSLDAFVRRFEMRGVDQILRPPWLPRKDMVQTHVDREEAPDAAKEIFRAWAEKVRKTIPSPTEWEQHPAWLEEHRMLARHAIPA